MMENMFCVELCCGVVRIEGTFCVSSHSYACLIYTRQNITYMDCIIAWSTCIALYCQYNPLKSMIGMNEWILTNKRWVEVRMVMQREFFWEERNSASEIVCKWKPFHAIEYSYRSKWILNFQTVSLLMLLIVFVWYFQSYMIYRSWLPANTASKHAIKLLTKPLSREDDPNWRAWSCWSWEPADQTRKLD